MPLIAILFFGLLLLLLGLFTPVAVFVGWLLVAVLGIILVAWIVLRVLGSELIPFLAAVVVVGVVCIGAAYLLEGVAYLVPTWLVNWLADLASMVPPKWQPMSVLVLIACAVILYDFIRTLRFNREAATKHPRPGDPEYLDWANRQGKFTENKIRNS
jgi:hypothetical protein